MKLFRKLKKLKLTEQEKQNSLEYLLFRIEPVRKYFNNHHNKQKVTFLPLLLNHKYMLAGLLIAAILAMGGGTAVAAENALPGDLLYPLKLRVNEEVREVLSVKPEAKVAWETRRAERRLEEVEKLVEQGRLTTSTSAVLAEKFAEFANRAEERLTALKNSGVLNEEQIQRLRENFEVAVKAHSGILSRVQERQQNQEQLQNVANVLREKASSTIRERLEREWGFLTNSSSSTLQTLAENKKNVAQNKINEVENFVIENSDKVSAEDKLKVQEKLTEAKNALTTGDTAFISTNYGEAVVKYFEAHRLAQEAKVYMSGLFRFQNRLMASSTMEIASGTPRFTDEEKQERWDARENLRQLEEKLREEVREARQGAKNRAGR